MLVGRASAPTPTGAQSLRAPLYRLLQLGRPCTAAPHPNHHACTCRPQSFTPAPPSPPPSRARTLARAHTCRSPAKLLGKKNVNAQEFGAAAVQAVSQDGLDEPSKLHLLAFLHEHGEDLFTDVSAVEHAVASLQAVLAREGTSNTGTAYRGQVLVAITALMIEHDFLTAQFKSLKKFLDQLLNIIATVNVSNAHYRRTACQCLHELELAFPGIMARKLGHIADLCAAEKTFAAEAYTALLAVGLHQAVTLLINRAQGTGSTPVSSHRHHHRPRVHTVSTQSAAQPLRAGRCPLAGPVACGGHSLPGGTCVRSASALKGAGRLKKKVPPCTRLRPLAAPRLVHTHAHSTCPRTQADADGPTKPVALADLMSTGDEGLTPYYMSAIATPQACPKIQGKQLSSAVPPPWLQGSGRLGVPARKRKKARTQPSPTLGTTHASTPPRLPFSQFFSNDGSLSWIFWGGFFLCTATVPTCQRQARQQRAKRRHSSSWTRKTSRGLCRPSWRTRRSSTPRPWPPSSTRWRSAPRPSRCGQRSFPGRLRGSTLRRTRCCCRSSCCCTHGSARPWSASRRRSCWHSASSSASTTPRHRWRTAPSSWYVPCRVADARSKQSTFLCSRVRGHPAHMRVRL